MNQKQFTILVIVGLVLGIAGLVVYQTGRSSWQQKSRNQLDHVVPDFPLNEIAQVTVTTGEDAVHLVKTNGVWAVAERSYYPADFADVGKLLQTVWELKPTKEERVGPSQYGRIEVRLPEEGEGSGTLLEFKDDSGAVVKQLVLGKQVMRESSGASQFGGPDSGGFPVGRFVRTVGDPARVFLVSETFSSVTTEPESWLNRDFFAVKKAKSIEVESEDQTGMNWAVARESETGDWHLVDANEGESLDSTQTYTFNNVFSSPTFNDVSHEEFDPEFTAVVNTFEDFTYRVMVGPKDEDDRRQLQVEVSAKLPEARQPAEDEVEADKEKLDNEFEEKRKELAAKLEKEKALEGWTYQVSNWTVNAVAKKRSDILKKEEEETSTSAQEESESPVEINNPLQPESIDPLASPPLPEDQADKPESDTDNSASESTERPGSQAEPQPEPEAPAGGTAEEKPAQPASPPAEEGSAGESGEGESDSTAGEDPALESGNDSSSESAGEESAGEESAGEEAKPQLP